MANFAWGIRGGDTIYVGDAERREIVGMGYATADIGKLAYRFDGHSPISSRRGVLWCHLIDMDWEEPFVPFGYKDPNPQTTVLKLKQDEIKTFDRSLKRKHHSQRGLTEQEEDDTLLLEESYSRYTTAASRVIFRKHVALSNRFKSWMKDLHSVYVRQERQHVDATFEAGGKRFLAEFKIAYHDDTKRAIREALGQILEYNYYPPRVSHDHSLLILDMAPGEDDRTFLRSLREKFSLPLNLGWESKSGFEFDPPLSL
jgi:hypothetical protein